MFDHVTIRASARDASERFYDTVLPAVGIEKTHSDEQYAEWGDFSVMAAEDLGRVTRRLHVGFGVTSPELVDEFWRTGTAAGYTDDGAPGPRPQYTEDYYGAFLLDPDGNSAEAVHHEEVRTAEAVDHLWIRVADLQASASFYELMAPHAGFREMSRSGERVGFAARRGSFSVVAGGEPTENLHMAFPAGTNSAVDEYHLALTQAGHRDNGPPGERQVYHPRYYSAFVLDPDGNNIELVNHNRG